MANTYVQVKDGKKEEQQGATQKARSDDKPHVREIRIWILQVSCT